jgi:hypothetical protein
LIFVSENALIYAVKYYQGHLSINKLILKTKGGKGMKKKVFISIMFLAALLLFSSGTATADGILFPYWISGGGYATFIQIVNLATVDTPITGTTQGKLHYVYVYNSDTETCQHYDDTGKTTHNDILLYEVTKAFYQGISNEQLLPGDTTSTSPTLSSSHKWGYLVVTHHEDNFASGHEGELFGQEYVVDLNTGTIWANNAINDPDEIDTFPFYENAFDGSGLFWIPELYASTMWYFFPVYDGIDLSQTDGIVWDNAAVFGYLHLEPGTYGVYDNNESLKSGYKILRTGCWDTDKMDGDGYPIDEGSGPVTANFFYTLKDILTGEQYAATANTGGWTEIEYYEAGYAYKLQSTELLGHAMNTILFESSEPGDSYTK